MLLADANGLQSGSKSLQTQQQQQKVLNKDPDIEEGVIETETDYDDAHSIL